ncbi:MAG: 3-deoxy-D-manno-octulosonic acid transferase [Candidatus Omnitrophota bacterium]
MLFFDLLYALALILCLPRWIKVLLKKEYRTLIKHRLIPEIQPSASPRLWIHAVSIGEARSLKSLITQLSQIYNHTEIVLSVSTPTGYEMAKKDYPDITVINAPVDFSFTIRAFIKRINPKLLVLNELEIWPNWVRLVHRNRIPILLINGRISEKAFHRYKQWLFVFKPFFRKIDHYLVQARIYKDRFEQLHIPSEKITICGNIKADEAFDRLSALPSDSEISDYLGINPAGRKIVILASTHPQDDDQWIPVIPQTGNRFLFILFPRQLDRIPEIEKRLEHHRVPFSTWSKNRAMPHKTDHTESVLIFDQIGYLFNALKIADIVGMGGTFDPKTGGHNFYEPAVLGKWIIGGPHYNNFPEIGKELINRGVYYPAQNAADLLQKLLQTETINWDRIRQDAVEAVSERRGSISCTIKKIQGY